MYSRINKFEYSEFEYYDETAVLFDDDKPESKKYLEVGGVYRVTLESKSIFGTLISIGKAIIVKLAEHEYEIKAVLYPKNPPLYGISDPLYIHAIATEKADKTSLMCTGQVYVTKGFLHKIIEDHDVRINFTNTINSETNDYQFSMSPLTLWGSSPGKIHNSGTLTRLSNEVDDATRKEVAYCDKLKIR